MAQESTAAAAASERTVGRDDAEIEFARVVAFSDGVFAIAITLLVLALEVPASAADLEQGLLDLSGNFFAYALSFAVIGRLWLSHHRFFGSLQRFDGKLMGLNLFYLGWVCLIPFSSSLLGSYGENSTATIAYAINMVGASGLFVLQIRYAYRHDMLREWARPMERRYAGPANLVVVLAFGLSIPIALLSTEAAQVMWVASFLAGRRASDWYADHEDSGGGASEGANPTK